MPVSITLNAVFNLLGEIYRRITRCAIHIVLSLIYFFFSSYYVMCIALRTDGQEGVLRFIYPYFHIQKKICLMKTPVS